MQTYPPGTRIGQYEIASLPMMGGMGVVYFALNHGNDGRPVALKTFRPELLPDRAARDRFLREGTTWVELGYHPHIVRCYSVEYIDPITFLVLELIAKEPNHNDASLRSWLGAPIPVEQALLFALQIARGMKHAVGKIPGFVHRDLKPENVLVGADRLPGTNINRLRVTDFGLVKILAENLSTISIEENSLKLNQIQFTRGAGTPLYMAPEQWIGEQVGVYTDVYALGCILYEMLTGQRAAEGKTISELQAVHCGGKLHTLPTDLQSNVRTILTRSLSLQPTERYQSWSEVTHALEMAYAAQGSGSVSEERIIEAESLDERVRPQESYNEIGLAYVDIGKAELAAGCFEKTLALAREIGDREGEGVALGNLGNTSLSFGDAQRAIGYYEQQIEIMREIGDRRGQGTALGNLGQAYAALGYAHRAIGYYEQSLEIARAISDRLGEGVALTNLGNAYENLGDFRKAIKYHEQRLKIARAIGDRRGEETALVNLGNAYENLGDSRQAIEYHRQSLVIGREIGDRRGEGASLSNLGNSFLNLGDAQQAIVYYEQGLEIDREIGDRRGEGTDLGNLGSVYLNLGDERRAIGYYEQALVIDREIGDRHGEGTDFGNLGNAVSKLGDRQRAIECYEQQIKIVREIGDLRGVAFNSFNLADEYRLIGNIARALPLAQEAVQAFAKIGHSEYTRRAQQLVARLQGKI
jgi:tetratricopeptide (TPR) repeat protein